LRLEKKIERIETAITASVDGDSVVVSPGVYYKNNIQYYGKVITVCSTGPDNFEIVLSTIVDAESLDVVFRMDVDDTIAVLAGFTITPSNILA